MLKILHIIEKFSGDGPTRSLLAAAKYSVRLGLLQQHRAIALQAKAYPIALLLAKQAGVTVLSQPGLSTIRHEIVNADLVQVHFWNNPIIYELLRLQLPAMRLLLWLHILGNKPPQIITKKLINYSDFVLVTNPYSLKLPVFQNLADEVKEKKTDFVYALADFDRLSNLQPRPHNTFNVGYIGTVNFSKMHPRYISMSAQIDIPNLQFIICGGGREKQLQQQAEQLGIVDKFSFQGYVENIKPVLEVLDVFGYPLCEDTFATSEKSLQEAMYAGVPPVVLPYGGVKDLVKDNETGLVVDNELEYKQAIEYLYHHPEERARLGRNAREYARQAFDGEQAVQQLDAVYQQLMQMPKRQREWSSSKEPATVYPAEWFIQSLEDTAPQFHTSMTSQNLQEVLEADREIAASSILLSGGEGGIIQYRNYYPHDGYLRLWSGLVLQQQGKNAEAVSEFTAAIELGGDRCRINWYLAQVAEKVNNLPLAAKALREVVQAAPDFTEARQMLKSLENKK
ncbi:MAG: glycosyltransferase [Aphanothece sp. CMT-3BRIN-NPC111]|jgi:glycosyltransferase involved in cell wall biosynthesis|nr:glycosyltransferase [Aphanothece sp. CMT-3BRIN-NPC111]